MIIGRWQPLTDEDKSIIEQKISEGHNILICITDNEPSSDKPLTSKEVESELKKVFWKYLSEEKIKTIIIPEIE